MMHKDSCQKQNKHGMNAIFLVIWNCWQNQLRAKGGL